MRPSAVSRTIVAGVLSFAALAACGGDDDAEPSAGGTTVVASGNDAEAPPTAPPSDADGDVDGDVDGDDDGDDGDVARTATTLVEGGVEIDEVPDDPAAGGEPTGTISVGGETWEIAGLARMLDGDDIVELGGDFLICEGDNPAFPGDANIIAVLDDDLQFSFLKSGDTTTAEYGGLFGAEETTAVEFEREGTAISGTAEFADAGTATFRFDCG